MTRAAGWLDDRAATLLAERDAARAALKRIAQADMLAVQAEAVWVQHSGRMRREDADKARAVLSGTIALAVAEAAAREAGK